MSAEFKNIRFTFFQLPFTVQLYKVSDVRPPIFPSFFFSFFFVKQDGYGAKASRFENPILRTSYFSTVFYSKHKLYRLSLSWMPKQFFNVCIIISTRLTRSMEEDFSHKYQLWKLFRWIRHPIARDRSYQLPFNRMKYFSVVWFCKLHRKLKKISHILY